MDAITLDSDLQHRYPWLSGQISGLVFKQKLF